MKKVLFFIGFIFLFFPINSVFAGNTDYKISYDITSFSIGADKDTITLQGWSFLDHMDNFGGINLETGVAVYTGSWKDSWNEPTKCKASANCQYVKAKVDDEGTTAGGRKYNLYLIRCTDYACNLHKEGERAAGLMYYGGSNNETFLLKSCTGSGDYGGSHCLYRNVGFKATLSIEDILDHVGDANGTSTIKFRLISKVGYGSNRKCTVDGKCRKPAYTPTDYKRDSADIGIIPSSCTSIGGSKCDTSPDNEYTLSSQRTSRDDDGVLVNEYVKRKVSIGGLSDNVLFTAGNASGSHDEYYTQIRGYYFSEGATYKILEVTKVFEKQNWKGNYDGTVWGRLFKIQNGNDVGYAWSAWVKSKGALQITINQTIKKIPNKDCPNLESFCIGGNCNYVEENGKVCKYNRVTHGKINSYTCSDVSLTGCGNKKYNTASCKDTISSKYYYRLSASEVAKYFPGVSKLSAGNGYVIKKRKESGTNYYYFPIKFYANVKYVQNATLNLVDFSNKQVVHSGLSFPFGIDYQVSAKWNYLNYVSHVAKDSTADSAYQSVLSNAKGIMKGNGDGTEVSNLKIYISLKDGDKLYSYSEDDNQFVYFANYNAGFYKKIVLSSMLDQNELQDLDTSKNTVVFDNSNDANSSDRNSSAGNFSCEDVDSTDWAENTEKTVHCQYKIKQAYFKNNGDGSVVYDATTGYSVDKNNLDGQKSLYYIPVNSTSRKKFKFDINVTNLSLISGVKYAYKATCQVTPDNVIHSDKLSYRAIDEKNPFPKVTNVKKYPENWQQYIDNSSNGLNRVIEHSFDAVSYQTIFTKNKFSKIKSDYGDYSSYDDIKLDGSGSSSVIRSDLFTTINRTHCKAGKWNSSCDKVQS